jgi:hypothetical protein
VPSLRTLWIIFDYPIINKPIINKFFIKLLFFLIFNPYKTL